MTIDNQALLAAIDQGRENAYGSDEQSVIGQKRARAIEYYLGLNTNPAPEGRSQVVDRSVYETISVIMPSLVRIFAGSSEEVCKCVAAGPDDEEAAEQQTAVLNHVVTQMNQWEQICADWIHDSLLLMNGYCLAYWDESDRVIKEVYEGQSEDQLAVLLQDKSVQVVEHSERVDEQATQEAMQEYQQVLPQWQQAAMQAQAMGEMPPPPPEQPQPVVLHDVVLERRENEGKVCLQVLPPEHCYVSIDTPDWTLNECPYFEFRQRKTIADLRAMGLDVPDDVSDNERDDSDEDWSRDRFGEDRDREDLGIMRRVWARMIWVRADAEGDGESKMYYVLAVGRTILHAEPVGRVHVASMTPQPLPHRHVGMGVGETVHDIQDVKTAIKRGALDNLYLANNGRHVISDKVNLADFLESRPGGVIRMVDGSLPADGHVVPLVHPFAFDSIVGSLEYFDQDRQNRTGASRYFSGTDAGAINKTASGTMALQNMASMRMEHIARMMAPAVETLFSIVQEIIAKHQNKALSIKLTDGKWVTVDPQAWRTKRDVRISVGVGAGNKDSMMQQLGMVYGAQMQLMPLGLADRPQIHATVTEMCKLAGFANPAKFWVDPATTEAPEPPPDPQVMKVQLEMQKAQMDAQLKQQESATDIEFKRQDAAIELEKAKVELQIKLAELEIKRQELELKAQGAQIDQELAVQKTQHEMQRDSVAMDQKEREIGMNAEFKTRELDQKERATPEGMDGVVNKAVSEVIKYIEGSRPVGIERIKGPDGKLTGARRRLANGKTEDVTIQ